MINNSRYYDEHGTAVGGFYTDMNSKDLTEAINSSKNVAESKLQNNLYEEEIKSNKRIGIVTLIISSAALLISAIDFIWNLIINYS